MVRNGEPSVRWLCAAENDMAPGLVVLFIADLPKGLGCLSSGDNGQSAQTVTSTVSSMIGGGTGSSCFARLSR